MAFDLSKLTSLLRGDLGGAKPGKRAVVGVDVGSSAIKVVQLYDNKGIPTLETYGELQLGPYEGGDIGRTTHLPITKLTEVFVDILRESSVTAKDVALAISYNASFTSVISVSTTDMNKIMSIIPVEARKYVPVPLSEVTLDWFPVSTLSERSTTNVLLVAIHNERLKHYDAMVKGASLNPILNELEMFSTIRSSVSQDDETVALVDMGAGSTKLSIVEKGVIAKTHSVLMSGVECTIALQKALDVPFKVAEEQKRTSGLYGDKGDLRKTEALQGVIERGMRELHKVMRRFEETEEKTIGKVILTGSGSLLRGVDVYAHDMFSKQIVLADPFSKVAYPAFLEDTLKEAGPSFAVAVGAALRGLLPK